jgi:hypothetical protein
MTNPTLTVAKRDYRNFRTFILKSGKDVVSAISVGCHTYKGEIVAEIMALSTSRNHRRKGHGRRVVGICPFQMFAGFQS